MHNDFLHVLYNPQLASLLNELVLYQQQHEQYESTQHGMNTCSSSQQHHHDVDNIQQFHSQQQQQFCINQYNVNNTYNTCNFACKSTSGTCHSPQSTNSAASTFSCSNTSTNAHVDDQTNLLSKIFSINGKEYCLVEKSEYKFLTENCPKRALETNDDHDHQISSNSPQSKKRKKVTKVKTSYTVNGVNNLILIMEGTQCFHTESDVYFVDLKTKSQLKFKLVKGFIQGVERFSNHDEKDYHLSLKIGSQKTFNSKSAVTYRLLFELEKLKEKLVEWTVVTKWKGYPNKSFKSLDIASSTVEIVNK